MQKHLKETAVVLIAVLTAVFSGSDERAAEAADISAVSGEYRAGEIYCTVLGDSIAKGYSDNKNVWIECYGRFAVKWTAWEGGCRYKLRNYAENGLTTEELNADVLTRKEVLQNLEKSDIIFISTGSNDLLDQCTAAIDKVLDGNGGFRSAGEALEELRKKGEENPALIPGVIAALEQWDYHSFENEWTDMMDALSEAKREEARIIVNNIYNPAVNMNLPGAMNRTAADIIGNMNGIIDGYAGKYGYTVADLSSSDICFHVQSDGIHPDQKGQEIIAEIVCGCLK